MILVEVHEGLFAETFRITAPIGGGGWRLLTLCDGDLPEGADTLEVLVEVCPLLREVGELAGTDHFQHFHLLLQDVLRRAPMGLAWDQVFDDKHLHEVGDVVVTRTTGKVERWKVFQFEKQRTLVRVLWSYGSGRRTLLLTHMFVKPGGRKKTPRSEIERARKTLETYLAAVDAGQAKLITEQGGRDGFVKLAH
ncbi:type II toxin-antitoxin system RelE/ParE family toxin [Methylibium sp. Root1272]|uniref:type II toxin-antitoxin system RelE/ParE family toxin n=1 Tax=Methylibium sp. Root1272 TaxID=1736441 RepID=UPI0012E92BD0|nr:type II toxin-antitoxin system RelE/ParE family toxin [Methylibium sp. Root1272]